MEDFELELKQDFIEESLQLLDDSEQAFLDLENNQGDPEILDKIFRLAHNLKGTSRAVGFGEVAEFTHEMENLILKLKNQELEVSDYVVTTLLDCNDHVRMMIETLKEDLDATFDSSATISKVREAMSGETSTPDQESEPKLEAEPVREENFQEKNEWEDFPEDTSKGPSPLGHLKLDASQVKIPESEGESWETMDSPGQFVSIEEKSEEVVELKNIEKDNKEAIIEATKETVEKIAAASVQEHKPKLNQKKAAGNKANVDESIRVSLSRVELLNNYVGELVILQAMLNQHREEIQNKTMAKSLTHLTKLSKEIQDIAMRMRMLPLKGVFSKMQRIVRDSSLALDKKVKLHIDGEETEVDKTVLEQLSDPLVHIIRNAVDHGIENDSQDRIESGKEEMGNVYLNAFHEGNRLVIEIGDDGGGICPKVITQKAIEKGVLRPGQKISDKDAVNLIFHPGFSTKAEVSEISGRGVGMDVVKTNIDNIGGSVEVDSHVGKGSIFRISLPLTLAIIDGMVTKVGNEKYVVPVTQIHETLQVDSSNCEFVSGLGECLNLRGEVMPAFRLSKELNRKPADQNYQIGIIVQEKGKKFAMIVDDIVHQQQVVIKKIGEEIKNKKGFMGSSILGDGKPAFILDLHEMVESKIRDKKNIDPGLAA